MSNIIIIGMTDLQPRSKTLGKISYQKSSIQKNVLKLPVTHDAYKT